MKDETIIQKIKTGKSDNKICNLQMDYYFRPDYEYWFNPLSNDEPTLLRNRFVENGYTCELLPPDALSKASRFRWEPPRLGIDTWRLTYDIATVYFRTDRSTNEYMIQVCFDGNTRLAHYKADCDPIDLIARTMDLWKETKARCEKLRKQVQVSTTTVEAVLKNMIAQHNWEYHLYKKKGDFVLSIKLKGRRSYDTTIPSDLPLEQLLTLPEKISTVKQLLTDMDNLKPTVRYYDTAPDWQTSQPQ
ncbi:MAG: hypothetical protein HUK17_03945 [Bacteroidales bacterium]|nr:hypothetical protein [Bacteroidales bacterium]